MEFIEDACLVEGTVFTPDDLVAGIKALKTNKAAGNCNITAEVLRICNCPSLATILCDVYN